MDTSFVWADLSGIAAFWLRSKDKTEQAVDFVPNFGAVLDGIRAAVRYTKAHMAAKANDMTGRKWLTAMLMCLAAAFTPLALAQTTRAPLEVGPEGTIEERADRMAERARVRDAMRQRAIRAARERGYTPQQLRAMSPEERAALMRQLRADGALATPPAWRERLQRRRLGAGDALEQGALGRRWLRAQVIATDPTPQALAGATARGFRILRERSLQPLGLRVVVLAAPRGMTAERALQTLRDADPVGAYDLNHVFDPSAAQVRPASARATGLVPGRAFEGRGLKIGIVDTGADSRHPALTGARLTTRSFVETGADAEVAHGTAVAALLVGAGDGYQGVIPGAHVFVADVFGSSGEGGSVEAIAQALAWLESENVDVINISLEGPPNRTLETVISALVRRGRVIVAAVGNDGPTQPVAYPAAYEGVVGVTAIDAENRVYITANRGPQVAFAALGVNILAAVDDRAYAAVSGTSFAAPVVAAALAAQSRSARASSQRIAGLAANAVDLGPPGRDPIYGIGAVLPVESALASQR